MILRVDSDTLASVMILDKRLEEYPEPYRGQSDITLVVSFAQYTKFIDRYLEVTDYLATSSVLLKSKLALSDEEVLQQAFYKDMACAVMKELWYTHRSGGRPTKIIHSLDDSPVYGNDYVDVFCDAFKSEIARSQDSLLELLSRGGYEYALGILNQGRDVVKYASLLYAMSSFNNEFGIDFVKWSMTEV